MSLTKVDFGALVDPLCKPKPVSELPYDLATLCMNSVPMLPHAIGALIPSRTDGRFWVRELDRTQPLFVADPLLDDAFCGPVCASVDQLRLAVAEMCGVCTGTCAAPRTIEGHGLRMVFCGSLVGALMWCIHVLLIDRGDEQRTSLAVRRGMPAVYVDVARAVILRAVALLTRACLFVSGLDELDARVNALRPHRMFGLPAPMAEQVIVLRPSVAKAFASVLLAANIWTPETTDYMPIAMLSAFDALPFSTLANHLTCDINEFQRRMLPLLQCQLGPPVEESPLLATRVYPLPRATMASVLMSVYMMLRKERSFISTVMVRDRLWNQPIAARAFPRLLNAQTMAAAYQTAAHLDQCLPLVDTRADRFFFPLAFIAPLTKYVATARSAYGSTVPLDVLLSSVPLGLQGLGTTQLTAPPVTPVELWRRVVPLSLLHGYPIGGLFSDIRQPADEQQHLDPLIRSNSVLLHLLNQSTELPTTAFLMYVVGPTGLASFAQFVAAVRLMSAVHYGDRAWNRPEQVAISDNALAIDSACARVFAMRALLPRLFGRPNLCVVFPYMTPTLGRELMTLHHIGNPTLRTEMANALCDLIVSLLRRAPPPVGMGSFGNVMCSEDMKIALGGSRDVPWSLVMCSVFLPRFLGPVTSMFFTRSWLCNSSVLYNGYRNTVLAMMRSPRDPNSGFWRWPAPVMMALLRFFFLVYCRQRGVLHFNLAPGADNLEMPAILRDNPTLVQALAFHYMSRVVRRADLADMVTAMKSSRLKARANARIYKRSQDADTSRDIKFELHDLKRMPEMYIEECVLERFPLRGMTISEDIRQMLPGFATAVASSALVFHESDSTTLQMKPGDRHALTNNGMIMRAILRLMEIGSPVEDLATMLVAVSSSNNADNEYKASSPSPAERESLPKPVRISRKKQSMTTQPMDGEDDEDHLTASPPPAPQPAVRAMPRPPDFFVSDADVQRNKRQRAQSSSSSSSASYDANPIDLEAARREALNKRYDKLEERQNTGKLLSRFIVLALTIAASEMQAHDSSVIIAPELVRAGLCTMSLPYGEGGRAISWESSSTGARNRFDSVSLTMRAIRDSLQSLALPHVHRASDSPPNAAVFGAVAPPPFMRFANVPISNEIQWDDVALTSLFDLELSVYVNRTWLTGHAPDWSLLHNSVPTAEQLNGLCGWDIPFRLPAEARADQILPVTYVYTLPLGIGTGVRDCVGDPMSDVPYCFELSLWNWRALPSYQRPSPPTRPVRCGDAVLALLDNINTEITKSIRW